MPAFFRERVAKHFGYSASSEVRWIQHPRDIGGFEAEPPGDDPVRNASKRTPTSSSRRWPKRRTFTLEEPRPRLIQDREAKFAASTLWRSSRRHLR